MGHNSDLDAANYKKTSSLIPGIEHGILGSPALSPLATSTEPSSLPLRQWYEEMRVIALEETHDKIYMVFILSAGTILKQIQASV